MSIKKAMRKAIALTLAAVLVFGIAPITASASDPVTYDNFAALKAGIEAVTSGGSLDVS